MTGQTLQTLENYPNEREPVFSTPISADVTRLQSNLNLLNTKKADIDKINIFTALQNFSGGVAKTGSTKTASTYTVLATDTSLYFDTTSNAIAVTLPEAADVLDQEFDFWIKTRPGSYNVTISTATGEVVNATGNNTIVMNTTDDYIKLKAVNAGRWLIITNTGCDLSTTV